MRIIDYNTTKHQQYQDDMGCAFGKSQAGGTTKDRISFAEFKDQEGRLK